MRTCIHNSACFCTEGRCSVKCGWNPKGWNARQKEIRQNGLTVREQDGMRRLIVKKGASNG